MSEQIDAVPEQPLLSPDKPHVGAHPAQCPVVGLGASAGGLEAFQNFLAAVPADSGQAFVLVQHLDPNHESMLAELLGRRTEMPVRQAADGMPIEANNVYLIPPNANMTIEKAHLRLSEFSEPRGFRRPIDVFFRSLAFDQGSNAACVVLSGTGGDGAEGLRAVKEAGGLTLAQEPETAKYDGMPKSAVATGLVDKVLAVRDMPAAIRDYFERGQSGVSTPPDVTDFLLKVSEILRFRIGHDFSQYKRTTMMRRVQRRMQVVGVSGGEYLERLRDNAVEAELLFRDLLINVTCFFRDAEAFNALREEVIPELFKGKGAGDTIRIWTPGCSSGEEAYSLAILLAEALSRARVRPSVQIFATDIDEAMLQKARTASYPHTAVRDVPIELLDRYFFAQEDDYVLSQQIRDMVRFSNHNLIKDAPFSRIDLLVCRNLLIYLDIPLQQRLIPVFHYALRQRGWLFLGTAENIANRVDLFHTIDAGSRIFQRKGLLRQPVSMPLSVGALAHTSVARNGNRPIVAAERPDAAARRMMERYAPAHVVVNSAGDITHASSRTSRYMELAEGRPTHKVTDLAKRGLRSAIRNLLESARQSGRRTIKRDIKMVDEDERRLVDVVADPINEEEILLVFQDSAAQRQEEYQDAELDTDSHAEEQRFKQLEDELDETRTRLRTTVEELETSNEELKSSNEEMMSMNEELQSTNEELATVNEELKNKVDQLARSNSDLQNFIESTQVPTVVLDKRMRIRSFTPATRALFRFQEQDKGRPLSDLFSRADRGMLEGLSRKVLATGEPLEQELNIEEGRESFVLRVMPYRDAVGSTDGVILVFSDVTKIRQTQADLARNVGMVRQRSNEIETLYRTAPVGMALVDRNRRFLKINQQFADVNGRSIEEHIGCTLKEILPELGERLDRPISEVFDKGCEGLNLEISGRINGDKAQDFLVDLYPYLEDQRVTAVGIVLKEVTELRRLEKEMRRLMDELQHRVKNTLAAVASIVNQTVATKADRTELIDTIKKRLGALAATHDLLTARDWRDVSLRTILETELKPFDQHGRTTLTGPEVALPPRHALSLTLTIHELATNAAKYGALAKAEGKLNIHWVVSVDAAGSTLTLHWVETGVGKLEKKIVESFGTRLIRNAVVHDLRGHCDHRLADDGLNCILTIPL
jgi:two-component system CheB/CheR fusion protein